ncbi:MAG: hypothetical protein ACK5LC_06005, partial [Coprobacillaceae bacterium]
PAENGFTLEFSEKAFWSYDFMHITTNHPKITDKAIRLEHFVNMKVYALTDRAKRLLKPYLQNRDINFESYFQKVYCRRIDKKREKYRKQYKRCFEDLNMKLPISHFFEELKDDNELLHK